MLAPLKEEFQPIQPGRVVRLKSGGPEMTSRSRDLGGQLVCNWFVKGEFCSASFVDDQLEYVHVDR